MNEPENNPPDPFFDTMLRQTQAQGELMARDLLGALPGIGLSSDAIKNTPVICLDIAEGAEIVAFDTFPPSHLYVNESFDIDIDEGEFLTREDTQAKMEKVITTLMKNRPASLFRLPAERALAEIKRQIPPVKTNLITRLNTFPTEIEKEKILTLIPQTTELLNPGGVLFFTVQEPDELPILQEVAQATIPGFTLRVVALGNKGSTLTSIGSHALIATKI
jgi:hypothetical protein